MTVNIKESSEEKYLKYINSKKNRECEIILRMLGNYGPYNLTTKQIRNKTIDLLKSRDMCHLFDSPLNTDIFDEKIKKTLLNESKLTWIDSLDDEKTCMLHRLIQDYKNHKNTTYDFSFQKSNIIAKSIYEAIIPRTYPFKSKAETKALIIEFFDGLDLDIDTKDEILYQYRQILNYIFQDRISDWIKSTKNETWCYQQLCTYLEKKGCVFIKKIGLSDIEFRCEFLKLILVDNFLIGDTKELFFIKIKKHWSQQKFRNKTTEKKAYNFMMHKNIKEKLDKLSKKQNLPRNEIIEELINKAYKDLKEVK